MRRILTITFLTLMFSFLNNPFSFADESGKKDRKQYEKQERETRKYREEQKREERSRELKNDDGKGKYVTHKRHKYRYYPSSSVYYDEENKVYFYLEGDHWGLSVNLPHGIKLGHDDFVQIQAIEGRPYDDHDKHQKKYGRHK
jgi:hypothetical protein